jgi:hypothetical protein
MNKNKYDVKLNSILFFDKNKNVIDYYKLLKKFHTFLIWAYYNKIKDYKIKNMIVRDYNNIYDYRENIGNTNSKLCKYITYQKIVINSDKLEKINKMVDKYFNIINNSSKKMFLEISNKYLNILKQNFKIEPTL